MRALYYALPAFPWQKRLVTIFKHIKHGVQPSRGVCGQPCFSQGVARGVSLFYATRFRIRHSLDGAHVYSRVQEAGMAVSVDFSLVDVVLSTNPYPPQ